MHAILTHLEDSNICFFETVGISKVISHSPLTHGLIFLVSKSLLFFPCLSISFSTTSSSFRLHTRAHTPSWPPSGPGLSLTCASGLRPAPQSWPTLTRGPLLLKVSPDTKQRQPVLGERSLSGESATRQQYFWCDRPSLGPWSKSKTRSTVGLIPQTRGSFLVNVLGKEMRIQWPPREKAFPFPASFIGAGGVGTTCLPLRFTVTHQTGRLKGAY